MEDTNCIDWTGSGTASNPFRPNLVIDPADDNLSRCGVNGLYTQLPDELGNPPRVKVRRTSNNPLVIGDGSELVAIPYQVADYESHSTMWSVGDPEKLYAPIDGLYVTGMSVRWPSELDTGRMTCIIAASGGNGYIAGDSRGAATTGPKRQHCATEVELEAGQYVSSHVLQTSGTDYRVDASEHSPTFWLRWVAPLT